MNSTLRKTAAPRPTQAGSAPPLPPGASPGKRWRFRRNLVIYVAHRQGLSQRLLADVFDLPRSRVAAILDEFRRYEPGADAGAEPGDAFASDPEPN